jgi:IPT/TIG domain
MVLRSRPPSGATPGKIQVTIGKTVLDSNVAFRVTPQITSFAPPGGGPVGTPVTIKGVSLTQTSRVQFGGGVNATFTVVDDTTVKTSVPTGAKTGYITVTTAGESVLSKTSFAVP